MQKSFIAAALTAVSVIFLFGCGNGDDNAASPDAGGTGTKVDAEADAIASGDVSVPPVAACSTVVSEANCDKTLRPFVFVHGTYGSGTNFGHVASLLESNGYCPDHIVAVEYDSVQVDQPGLDCNPPGSNTPTGCGKIDKVVNDVLAKFPEFTQVDLAGHSQGTEWCGDYIGAGGVGAHADKVAHYINFSGVPDVGNVQTLSVSSMHDLGGSPHHATGTSVCTIPFPDGASVDAGANADATVSSEGGAGDAGAAPACNVKQVTFINQDHFACAASTDTFIQLYRYLNGKDPKYTTVQCGDDPVNIVGIAETFADNTPVMGKIEVRQVTTPRAAGAPEQVIMGDATGHFGPVPLKRGAYYEFAGYDANGKLLGYQYFSPFLRSNYLLRFLTAASGSDGSPVGAAVASQSSDHFVRSANFINLVGLWAGGAFRQDLGASLKIEGNEVLTSDNTGTAAFMKAPGLNGGAVGLFMYDANKNGKSDLGLVTSGPFLSFTDVFVDAKTPKFVELSLTPGSEDPSIVDEKIVISNWPSNNAQMIATFQ
jgi:hypothetical protein